MFVQGLTVLQQTKWQQPEQRSAPSIFPLLVDDVSEGFLFDIPVEVVDEELYRSVQTLVRRAGAVRRKDDVRKIPEQIVFRQWLLVRDV